MKIKCHDKYNDQDLIIIIGDGEYTDYEINRPSYSSSDGLGYKIVIVFQNQVGDKDNCNPKRWSDLEGFEIIG